MVILIKLQVEIVVLAQALWVIYRFVLLALVYNSILDDLLLCAETVEVAFQPGGDICNIRASMKSSRFTSIYFLLEHAAGSN